MLGNKQGFDPEPSILPEVSFALQIVLPKEMDDNSMTMSGPATYKEPQDPRTVGFCDYSAELASMVRFDLVIYHIEFDPEFNTADAWCENYKCYDFILHFIYLSCALHARGHCMIGNVFGLVRETGTLASWRCEATLPLYGHGARSAMDMEIIILNAPCRAGFLCHPSSILPTSQATFIAKFLFIDFGIIFFPEEVQVLWDGA